MPVTMGLTVMVKVSVAVSSVAIFSSASEGRGGVFLHRDGEGQRGGVVGGHIFIRIPYRIGKVTPAEDARRADEGWRAEVGVEDQAGEQAARTGQGVGESAVAAGGLRKI